MDPEPESPHRTTTPHMDLHFAHIPSDGSPHRASRRSFENALASLETSERGSSFRETPAANHDEPSIHAFPGSTTRINHALEHPGDQLLDGVNHESTQAVRDPFPEQVEPQILDVTEEGSAHRTFLHTTNPAHPDSHSPHDRREALTSTTSSRHSLHSTLEAITEAHPSQQSTSLGTSTAALTSSSLPAPIPAFDAQRAPALPYTTSSQQPNPSPAITQPHGTSASTTTNPRPQLQLIRPASSANFSDQQALPASPRNHRRRRQRFTRWLRHRFRRQLPWLEGYLHGRAERREARRAIRAAEEAGFR